MSEQPDLDQLLYDAENGWMLSVDGRVALAAEVRRLRALNALALDDLVIALGRMQARALDAEARVATLTDTLRRRTESHGRLVDARLACPTCSRLPLEETPA